MRKLTVLAAAFAAGLTSFAANSAPHPSKSLRGAGSETVPVAKTQDTATAKNEKQGTKTTNAEARRPENTKAATAQPAKPRAKAEIVKTPLFTVTRAAAGNEQPAEKSEPKRQGVAEKREPKKERAAEKRSPERKRVAQKKTSKTEQVIEKRTRKKKQVAEKKTPKREQAAENKAPKPKYVAVTPTPKPQEPGDRQVAVREPVALDLVETASLGSKGAKTMKNAGGKYNEIIAKYAASYGVPVSLAHAVIQIESNYRPDAKGSAGEIGLMQIKPATARMMGYSGSAQGLFHPETNIKFGMKYLSKAQELGGGTTCGTILKYNAGHAARRMNPVSSAYCSKVKRFLGV